MLNSFYSFLIPFLMILKKIIGELEDPPAGIQAFSL